MDCEPSEAFEQLVRDAARSDGRCDPTYPGVCFYRVTRPTRFQHVMTMVPYVSVVAQGRKVARFGALELAYAPCTYLVVMGEGMMEGEVVEASPEAPYLSISVELPCELIAKTLLALADENAVPAAEPAPAFIAPADPAIKQMIVRYVRACEDPLERRIVAPLALEELVFRLLLTNAAAVLRGAVGRDRDADAIREAMKFIRERTARPLSVEDVARHVGMSPSHFAHRFRAVAQTSPMRYLKQLRLQEARALMLADGLRVAEVAVRVGYESASHFSRDFKSYFGAAPAEYVRQLRAGSGERSAVPDIVDVTDAN